jgi:hypothetical protein
MAEPSSEVFAAVLAGDMSVPAGFSREDLFEALARMLADPDPAVRDDTAYPIVATWIGRGEFDGMLGWAGDMVSGAQQHAEIQARTFGTMILAWVVRRDAVTGELDDATVRRWRDEFASWWSAEQDLRGYDPERGWLHAAAHGADTLRAFARSPRMTADDLAGLLTLATERLMAPAPYLFADQEEERLAYALASVLCRPELADVAGWLEPVRAALAAGTPGPVPAWVSNTTRTLAALYVAVHRGVRWYDPATQEPSEITTPEPERAAEILAAVAGCLRVAEHYLG